MLCNSCIQEREVKKTIAITVLISLVLCFIPVFGNETKPAGTGTDLQESDAITDISASGNIASEKSISDEFGSDEYDAEENDSEKNDSEENDSEENDSVSDRTGASESLEEAENPVFFVSAYGTEGSQTFVYSFLTPEKLPDEKIKMQLLDAGSGTGDEKTITDYQEPEKYSSFLQKNRLSVKYLFLIDCSTSMPAYSDAVSAYIKAVMEQNDESDIDALYSIAGCGKQMEMIKSDLADPEAVTEALDGMKYDQEETDLYTGVISALKTLNSQPLQPGSLTNLILITDGVPYIEEGKTEEKLAEKAKKKIEEYPDVAVHTFCLNEWQGDADVYLCSGTGHQDELNPKTNALQGSDIEAAAAAGKELAAFVNGLYLCVFDTDLYHARDRVDLQVKYQYEKQKVSNTAGKDIRVGRSNVLKNVGFLEIAENGTAVHNGSAKDSSSGETAAAAITSVESTAETSESEAGSTSAENTASDSEVNTSGSSNSAGTSSTALINAAATENSGNSDSSGKENSSKDNSNNEDSAEDGSKGKEKTGFPVFFIIGLAALAFAAAVFLIRNRSDSHINNDSIDRTEKDKPDADKSAIDTAIPAAPPAPPVKAGILIKIEVLKGAPVYGDGIVYLQKELIIGSDPEQCDIVLKDAKVSSRHARIFRRDGLICIEDLGSDTGTYLGGMRLMSSNRLRSGDELMAGDSVFVARF